MESCDLQFIYQLLQAIGEILTTTWGGRVILGIARGRFTQGKCFGGQRERGLIPRFHKLSWIPADDQWQKILESTRAEPLRNRVMLALAYDAGLRREELCSLTIDDVDFAHRLLSIRAETSKNRQARIVPYSAATGELIAAWLRRRRELSRSAGPLFLSESRRNHACPISIWTWTKVVKGIAGRAGLPKFTTHTLRHLYLTDLARAGWDIHEIALFAGHRSISSTQYYAKISPTKLAQSYADAGYFERNVRTIEVLIDRDAILSGAAAGGTPWQYFDLGHGYCTNSFFITCQHRMACARCDFYLPKNSSRAQMLEAKGNLQQMLQKIPLTDDERAAVEEGVEFMDKLCMIG